MALRIERNSIITTPTQDPSVVLVDADVTRDEEGTENPTMVHVSVLWNITTPRSVLKDAMRAAIRENAIQADLRATIGEEVVPAQDPAPDPVTNITITANTVTVNQAPGGA
jgi:hypothetical protein